MDSVNGQKVRLMTGYRIDLRSSQYERRKILYPNILGVRTLKVMPFVVVHFTLVFV
jgi:hypothetical protein